MYKAPIPCVILARKNSQGLKNKNIHKLQNKTLIEHSIIYAKKSKLISHVVVSTDDKRIFNIAKKYSCFCIYPRPKKYSDNFSRSEPAIKHALEKFTKTFGPIDIYAYLQVTEPLRPKEILDKCIKNLLLNKKIESSFAAYVYHKNFWIYKNGLKKVNKNHRDYMPRQKRTKIYREDTGVALASRYKLIKKGIRVGSKVKLVPYEGLYGLIDIHNKQDFLLAKKISNILKIK